MKRYASLLIVGTLAALASCLLIAQVPVSFLNGGIVFGGTHAQSSTQVIGTASFNGVGSITSLVTAGVVSGVTYNSTGNYTVSISPSTSNYLVFVQCSNDSGTFVGIPSIIYNSVGGTSFGINIIQVNGGGFSNHDFPINYVSVVKY